MQVVLAAPKLWQSARTMLAELFFLIGAATAASLALLKRADLRRVRAWLDALETMVRKLLLVEAAALAPSLQCGASAPRVAPRNAALLNSASTAAQTAGAWVNDEHAPPFALLPPEPHAKAHPARIRLLGPATSVREIWREQERSARIARLREGSLSRQEPGARLARRIAALARVIADPIPSARRLARLMRRKKQAAACILIARPMAPPPDFHTEAYKAANTDAHRAVIGNDSS